MKRTAKWLDPAQGISLDDHAFVEETLAQAKAKSDGWATKEPDVSWQALASLVADTLVAEEAIDACMHHLKADLPSDIAGNIHILSLVFMDQLLTDIKLFEAGTSMRRPERH
jgi:hypothetical protein